MIILVVLVSVGIHLVVGIIAGVVIVARYLSEPRAEFQVIKDIRLPAKQREHKMNMAAFDGMMSQPSFHDKMQSIRPMAFALPEMPKMDKILAPDPAAIISDQIVDLVKIAGTAQGIGADISGGAGEMGGVGLSFFGIQSTGKRILLLFDVSMSVVNKANQAGMPLSKIKDETSNLINKLPITARFGIIQFTQNYKPFRSEMLPATDQNRAAALAWIEHEWVEVGTMGASREVVKNPRGLVGVLDFAAKMQPDVMFIISDAHFQWKPDGHIHNIPWQEIAKIADGGLQGVEGCKIHFIGFQIQPKDKREMAAIVRKSGGKLREIE